MGTRAHFCTPNPSARVASSTQSKWPVACQTSPGSLSIGPTPILKLGVLLGHSSLSPATASACGAGERLLGPFAFGGKTNVIQVTTRVSDGLMDVDYQWDRNGACGYTQWRILAPISSRIRRIQPPLEARVWAKSRAGGRFAGGWRRHRYVGPLVYASQLAP